MKKFVAILAIAGSLVACDNAANTEQRTKDSLDSVEKAKKEVVTEQADKSKDSIEQSIEAQKNMADSLNKGTDTTKPKM